MLISCQLTFSFPLSRTLYMVKQRGYVGRRRWIITLAPTNKMTATYPGVFHGLPVFPIYSCNLEISPFNISWKTIEMKPTALIKSIGASYSAAALAILTLKIAARNPHSLTDVICTRSI